MATSAKTVFEAIQNHRENPHTLGTKIEQKLRDLDFCINEAVRYLQGFALNIAGNVASYQEIDELKKKYTAEGWGFYVDHRGIMDERIHITVRLKFPDEYTAYLDDYKAMAKKLKTQ